MSASFQILSHAGLIVRRASRVLVIDPWAVGSCYWRSWWNYPPVDLAMLEGLVPDAVYLTHSHWDHFHGPTLRRFSKSTPILIPFERSLRMKRDLAQMGFTTVIELAHGTHYDVADNLRLTSYQFSSPWGDSAAVVAAGGVTLLNANDAKLMGGPLEHIMRRHGRFDFVFRSHSSANDRVCYRYTDADVEEPPEDPSRYARSWQNFMNKVQPRYAIPFASNHCYLHRDVFHFNNLVETPAQVRDYVAAHGGLQASRLMIMLSGDSWSAASGFSIAPQDYFTNRDAHLARYAAAKAKVLERTYAVEARAKVSAAEIGRFFQTFFASIPFPLRRLFKNKIIFIKAVGGGGGQCFAIDIFARTAAEVGAGDIPEGAIVYETAAAILKKAMAENMFGHVMISKRVKYSLRRADLKHLQRFNQLLAAYEYDALPLRKLFSLRTLRVYSRRWRELWLYAQIARRLSAGQSIDQIEARYLRAE